MTQILQPGDVPALSGDDTPDQIDNVFAEQTWPAIWPRLVYHFANVGARDAALAGLGPTSTAAAYVKDIAVLFVWNGTAWKPVGGRRANGTVSIGALAAGDSQTVAVTFPAGLFTSAPRVLLSSGGTRLGLSYSSVTTSGFTLSAANYTASGAGATTATWVAEQL